METPVLFIIFNRPEITDKVFSIIRSVKPKYLYIAADGPRSNNIKDIGLCEKTRMIINKIDWDCNYLTLLRSTNLGCGTAVSEAINWFFSNVDEGIILEDDCLPDLSFFSYCTQLLIFYRNNESIMHISGTNLIVDQNKYKMTYSYYFSSIPHIWGWATWRRAWVLYDFKMKNLDQLNTVRKDIKSILPMNLLNAVAHGEIDTWDAQWLYTVTINHGIVIKPSVNLIMNIGLLNGTHMNSIPVYYTDVKLGKIDNLIHPGIIDIENQTDILEYNKVNSKYPKFIRIIKKLKFYFSIKSKYF